MVIKRERGAPALGARTAVHAVMMILLATEISGQMNPSCATAFTVVTQDKLNNIKHGLSSKDVKWFKQTFSKKYPKVCYADPTPEISIRFYITVTPDVYYGTRVQQSTSTQSNPVNGTVRDQQGNTSQISGTQQLTTTSSTAVPYSVPYGIYTLSVERLRSDGKFDVLQRFQQKGLYWQVFGISLDDRGHHPDRAVIGDAIKWISNGGLTDPNQSALGSDQK